jgi:hypothetical protein
MSPHPEVSTYENWGLGTPPELWLVHGDGATPRRLVLGQPFALVGRDSRNHVCLSDSQVSRRHAYLQVVAGQLFCVDLDSRTGVHWPDGPRPFGWVHPTEEIRIGPFTLSAHPANGDSPPAPPEWDPLGAAPPELTEGPGWFLDRWGDTSGLPGRQVKRVLTLMGRERGCKLRMSDPSVSRFHCSLVWTWRGLWAIDLLSREGTRLNGERINWARLRDGDRLDVGQVPIRVGKGEVLPPGHSVGLGRVSGPHPGLGGPHGVAAVNGSPPAMHPAGPANDPVSLRALGIGESPPGSPPDIARVHEAVFLPLLDQFNVVQEQMFDQFHRSLVGMAEVFGRLQQEQLAVVREELRRIHEVNRELQELQRELRNQAPGASPAAGTEDRPPGGTREEPGETAPSAGSVRDHAPPGGAAPVSAPDPRPSGQEKAPPGEPGRPAGEPTPPPPADIHARLFQRAAALADERKTRWQKLMDYITGQ